MNNTNESTFSLANNIDFDDLSDEIIKGENVVTTHYGNKRLRIEVVEKRRDYTVKVDRLIKEAYDDIFRLLSNQGGYAGYSKTKMVDDVFKCWKSIPVDDTNYIISKYKMYKFTANRFGKHITRPLKLKVYDQQVLWLRLTNEEIEVLESIKNNYFLDPPTNNVVISILFTYFVYDNEHLEDFRESFEPYYKTIGDYFKNVRNDLYDLLVGVINDACLLNYSKFGIKLKFLYDVANYIEEKSLYSHYEYKNIMKYMLKYVNNFDNEDLEYIRKKGVIDYNDVNKFNKLRGLLEKYEL